MTQTFPHPDMFTRVSFDFLKRLDTEPGAWVGQSKINGVCLTIHRDGKVTNLRTKGDKERVIVNTGQITLLEYLLDGMDGVSLQAEFIGPRADYEGHMPPPRIEIVDCLRWDGEWLRKSTFGERIGILQDAGIPHLPVVESPHLCDLYAAQLTDPVSEGIVVRSAMGGLVLHPDVCRVRSDWFKVKFRG